MCSEYIDETLDSGCDVGFVAERGGELDVVVGDSDSNAEDGIASSSREERGIEF